MVTLKEMKEVQSERFGNIFFFLKRNKICIATEKQITKKAKTKENLQEQKLLQQVYLYNGFYKRRGDPIPHLMRISPMGKISKLMGCIFKGPAKKSESAKSKGGLGLNNIMYDVPKWGPSSKVIDCINYIRSIIFTHHTRKMQLLSKQDTLLHGKDFH